MVRRGKKRVREGEFYRELNLFIIGEEIFKN